MSYSLEEQLDVTLNMRRQHRRQHEAERTQTEKAIRDHHLELERRQVRFYTEVRPLVQEAVERANRHLAMRPEKCQFCEVSGYFSGPLQLGDSVCNPIAYELRVDDREVGETLLIELTHDGMIEAFLGLVRQSVRDSPTAQIDFGWHPIPLYLFNTKHASELVIQYLAAITARWPLRREMHW